jgi:hypothetical protein
MQTDICQSIFRQCVEQSKRRIETGRRKSIVKYGRRVWRCLWERDCGQAGRFVHPGKEKGTTFN